jgi:hypothetical protein
VVVVVVGGNIEGGRVWKRWMGKKDGIRQIRII